MHETKKNHLYIETLLAFIKKKNIPIAALILKDNKILGIAQNKKSIYIHHAEILAMTQAQKKIRSHSLSHCILYSLVEPCPMCYGYAFNSNIKTIYYVAPSNKSGIFSAFNINAHPQINCIPLNYKKEIIQKKLSYFFSKIH